MKKILSALVLVGFVTISVAAPGVIYAGKRLHMKCGADPAKDPQTGKTVKPCGFETAVDFGGGMMSERVTGYCRSCRKFVCLSWTRENLPKHLRDRIRARPRPRPLGEVWDSGTGEVLTVHACPHCKGPFLEIEKADDVRRCPSCNKPGFGVDSTKPVMMYD